MKALSLWQPWASLTCLTNPKTDEPFKWIETRSWSTAYRGPLAIHAARTPKGFYALPGDCEGNTESGWAYGYIGDFQACYCYQTSDEGTRGDTQLVYLEADATIEIRPPMGAVVATCELVDVVPIIQGGGEGRFENHAAVVTPSEQLVLVGPERAWHWRKVNDQRAYGDFTPGRYAWILRDIKPVDPPTPARGHQGLWEWTA